VHFYTYVTVNNDKLKPFVPGLSVKTLLQAELMSVQGQHRHEMQREKQNLSMDMVTISLCSRL
jgi:hypothetical protein